MADNLTVKDSAAAVKTLRFKDLGAGILAAYHILLDSSGAEVLGVKAQASSIPVSLPNDQALLGRGVVNFNDSFTRPSGTPTYASGQLIANNAVAGSVIPFQFTGAARFGAGAGRITRMRLVKSTTTLTNAQFTVHLFKTSPTPTVGDTGVFNTAGVLACNNAANYFGKFVITMDTSFTDGAWGAALPGGGADDMHFKLASGQTMYGLLEARAAYAAGSAEVFTAYLEAEQT